MSSPEHGEHGRSSMRRETRVFLENLPKDIRKDEIEKEFSLFGKIAKIYLIYDPPGSGFVEYLDASDAEFAASSMNNIEFFGSKIKTKLTKGGVPRGRGFQRFVPRGRGFSYSYGDRSRGYSSDGGGRGSRFRGSSRGMRSFDYRGRGRGSSSFGSSRGGGGGFGGSRGGGGGGYNKGFSRDRFSSRGGGRGYSRGEGSSRGFSSRYGGDGYHGSGYEEDEDLNGYDKYDDYPKYERFGGKDYGEHDSRYSKYSPMDKYSSYKSRKDSYHHRSRSPLDMSPQGYRSASPSFQRKSRSPFNRPVRDTYYRNYEENPKSMSPGAREVFRRPRSKSSRNYSSEQSGEPSGRSYGQKEYGSSSYGSRRSPMDERF